MSKPPLTSEEKEEYARRLKATLKTRRPRKTLRLLVALAAAIAAVAMIWHFNRRPEEMPPVVLACLDGAGCVGKPVRSQAWLQVVELPAEKSAGLPVHWQRVDKFAEMPLTKTDSRGIAESESPAADAESIRKMQATSMEPETRYDYGRVFVFPERSKLVIVTLAPLAGAHVLTRDRDVPQDELDKMSAWKSAGWRFVYVVSADDPIAYRTIRDWVRAQVHRGLPDGPVLLSRSPDLTKELIPDLRRQTNAETMLYWTPGPPP
jgi:hypothetical protein